MSEYIFFEDELRDRFLIFVSSHSLHAQVRPDRIAGFVVMLPDNLPEAIEDALEDEYGRLMDEQQERIEAADGDDRTLMGVDINLPDGQPCVVRLPPALARRLCDHFSGDEIREIATAIAADVLAPSCGPICCER